jgi:hypothetical protein
MSQIKLKHSGGNGVTIAAPSSNPAADRTITLPSDADGTLARTLDVAYKSFACIVDAKDDNTDAGTFTSGAWRTRDLNTEIADTDGIVTLSNNQFTLGSGTYLIRWNCPAIQVGGHQSRLYSVTDNAAIKNGQASFAGNISSGSESRSMMTFKYTISGNTTFEIQHRCVTTSGGTWGLGAAASGSINWNSGTGTVIYTILEIFKEP